MTDRTVQPVHERTFGIAIRRVEPIDLTHARRLFMESRITAYLKICDDSSPDPSPDTDTTNAE